MTDTNNEVRAGDGSGDDGSSRQHAHREDVGTEQGIQKRRFAAVILSWCFCTKECTAFSSSWNIWWYKHSGKRKRRFHSFLDAAKQP
jgi:hypothetical protein